MDADLVLFLALTAFAIAIAGAVLRPAGSSSWVKRTAPASGKPRRSSRVRKKYSPLVTIAARPASASGSARASVRCSRLSGPPSRMNGLGRASRDTGQSRLPAPPERTTGMIILARPSKNADGAVARRPRLFPGRKCDRF